MNVLLTGHFPGPHPYSGNAYNLWQDMTVGAISIQPHKVLKQTAELTAGRRRRNCHERWRNKSNVTSSKLSDTTSCTYISGFDMAQQTFKLHSPCF